MVWFQRLVMPPKGRQEHTIFNSLLIWKLVPCIFSIVILSLLNECHSRFINSARQWIISERLLWSRVSEPDSSVSTCLVDQASRGHFPGSVGSCDQSQWVSHGLCLLWGLLLLLQWPHRTVPESTVNFYSHPDCSQRHLSLRPQPHFDELQKLSAALGRSKFSVRSKWLLGAKKERFETPRGTSEMDGLVVREEELEFKILWKCQQIHSSLLSPGFFETRLKRDNRFQKHRGSTGTPHR